MITIEVCVGSACYVKGSHEVINCLKDLIHKNNLQNKVQLKAAFCFGHCTDAVCVKINEEIFSVDKDNVEYIFSKYIKEKI